MSDYIVRAVTDDGLLRAFGCYTKNTVEKARKYHNTSPVATAAPAEEAAAEYAKIRISRIREK